MNKYLTIDEIVFIQRELINEFGGSYGIRDFYSLEASVMRPQSGHYEKWCEPGLTIGIHFCYLVNKK